MLIRGLRVTLPWLRVIASMRDPISRAISMLAHAEEKGNWGETSSCLAKHGLLTCVRSQLADQIPSEAPHGNLIGRPEHAFMKPRSMIMQNLLTWDCRLSARWPFTPRPLSLGPAGGYGNYSYSLSLWVAAFPLDQLLLLQVNDEPGGRSYYYCRAK